MILTITLNPAVDVSYRIDRFSMDTINRVEDVLKTAGGKGINVARVLAQLDEEVAASGFLGGSLGEFIRSEISALGINDFFVEIAGETRNCIAVIHDGQQTELLESGPTISKSETDEFLKKFSAYVQQVQLVTVSGSLPKGLPADFYVTLLEIAHTYNKPVLLDANGTLLKETLASEYKPYLIKPNDEEVADLLGKKSVNETQIVEALRSQLFAHIPWVVVTLGADGAIVKHDQTIYRAQAPRITAVNPVGSGDSVVAGFAAGIRQQLADQRLIKFGLAMGVLNAMEEKTGHVDVRKINWAEKQINVEQI